VVARRREERNRSDHVVVAGHQLRIRPVLVAVIHQVTRLDRERGRELQDRLRDRETFRHSRGAARGRELVVGKGDERERCRRRGVWRCIGGRIHTRVGRWLRCIGLRVRARVRGTLAQGSVGRAVRSGIQTRVTIVGRSRIVIRNPHGGGIVSATSNDEGKQHGGERGNRWTHGLDCRGGRAGHPWWPGGERDTPGNRDEFGLLRDVAMVRPVSPLGCRRPKEELP